MQLCSSEDHCPIPGQTCADLRGFECEGGACYCRWVHQARWKFVTGHELGHAIERYVLGELALPDYLFECDVDEGCEGTIGSTKWLHDPPGTAGGPCGCGHVQAANRQHCLQSIERTKDVWKEGYGHFFAASLFNTPTNVNGTSNADSCRFAYYKEILLDSCPDPVNMDCSPFGGLTRIMPPIAVDCGGGEKWRNTKCVDPTQPKPELEQMGTEQDWLQFFWNWNRRGPNNSSFSEMMEAQRLACHREHFADPEPMEPPPGDCITPGGMWRAGCSVPLCEPVNGTRPITSGFEAISGGVGFVWGQPRQPLPPDPVTPNPSDTPAQQAEKEAAYRQAFIEYQSRYGSFSLQRSLEEGVRAYYNAKSGSGEPNAELRLQHFQSMGDTRGVDENLAP